jgi:hypothetical protein
MRGQGGAKFDYSKYDADRRSFGFRLDDAMRVELFQISQRVARSHGIQDPTILESHHRLDLELWRHMGTRSRTYLEDGVIKIADDVPHLKTVTAEILPKLNKHLSRAVALLHEAAENDVFLTLIHDAAGQADEPADQVWGLIKFAETVDRAAKFKGGPGRNRRPDWVEAFCIGCQRFWSEHQLGGTSLNFDAPNPPKVAEWLNQIFEELRAYRMTVDPEFTGLRASTTQAMKKVAQTLPAYRTGRGSENGG